MRIGYVGMGVGEGESDRLQQALYHDPLRRGIFSTDTLLPLAQQLYDWLIRPAESAIAASQVQTLVFIPDGVLRNLPTVVSNPSMLDQVLTGLVENFTRTLPAGGHIQVQVTPAGDQLKLQFQSQPDPDNSGNLDKFGQSTCQTLKSIGQLLMFQPETGSLSLNLNVTKHLFQALGGKLIVRQRPQAGEVMTIFLPLEVRDNSSNQEGILV